MLRELLSAATRAAIADEVIREALSGTAEEIQASLSRVVLGLAGLEAGAEPRSRSPLADAARLSRWLPEGALAGMIADPSEDDTPLARRLGVLHEGLLEVRIRRLESTSVCTKPDGVWVSVNELLRVAPSERSAWLRRAVRISAAMAIALGPRLAAARREHDVLECLRGLQLRGTRVERAGTLVVDTSSQRRRSGSHYTPRELCRQVAVRTLEPLLRDRSSEELLDLRICDPAMGTGAFLWDVGLLVSEHVVAAWQREGQARRTRADAIREVASRCLYGVDRDPVARALCTFSLARDAGLADRSEDIGRHLLTGDSLIGRIERERPGPVTSLSTFDWSERFPEIFQRSRPGFDACIGNPPWVAFVGRAAQPLEPEVARVYALSNPAFRAYRTLHGLFIRRAAELLRPGGRLGLIVPTSVADLAGYGPTRAAHDELCEADEDLLDFGNGSFAGVFQPCMGLTSTRRSAPASPRGRAVALRLRSSASDAARALVAQLAELPVLPPELFGERGYQTSRDDLSRLARTRETPFTTPLHQGADVGEMSLAPPAVFADASALQGRFRPEREWREVAVLIRQTARYPIAVVSDGLPFRNSILAGFTDRDWTAPALAAYLNSAAVRWYHYARHRDAREGMPQLKIGHLRAIPALASSSARRAVHDVGEAASRAGGLSPALRDELDRTVFDALDLDAPARQLVLSWAERNPLPRPRGS